MRFLLGVPLLAALTLPVVADRAGKSTKHVRTPEMQRLLDAAHKHLTTAEISLARATYFAALRSSPNLSDYDRASILIGLGNCDLVGQSYSQALRFYQEASDIADSASLLEHQAVIAGNRAAVFRRMADASSALQMMRNFEGLMSRSRNPLVIAQLAHANRDLAFDRSLSLFGTALEAARATNQPFAESVIWNLAGIALEEHGRLADAERAYTEAFRIRVMNGRKNLQPSYFYLGRINWRLGRTATAVALLRRALQLSRDPDGQIQLPYVHHALARAYRSQGNIAAALRQFEAAVESMQEWRLQVLPADMFRISAEGFSQVIFSEYIEAGMEQYGRNRSRRLAARMLEIAENSRNWLFRERMIHDRQLPPAYFEALGKYRRMLVLSLDPSDRTSAREAERRRLVLSDLEARLGIETEHTNFSHQISENVGSDNTLIGVQTNLRPTEAFLSFHTGRDASYVWAVTHETFEVHRLAGRDALQSAIRSFREAILAQSEAAVVAGEHAADLVLGPVSRKVREKPEWVLSLDGPLFELPFSALPEAGGWVAEHHSIRLASSAFLNRRGNGSDMNRQFVALADPVFNRADSRWELGGGKSPRAELARLPGTLSEARACATAWGWNRRPVVLTGRDVARDRLIAMARQRPAVLHIATHFVPHPTFSDQILLALGMQPSGELDFLGPADIAFSRMPVGLVTLSGCHSGGGAALPGLGVFGLTRAWLMAGATAVVATHWPTADDSGGLLAAMYERLGQTTGRLSASRVAEALQAAQLRMIKAGGWRSKPVYWSAFEVMGKE